MGRQRDVPDDADEKWFLQAHSAAKHEILHRYLGAWLAILGHGRGGRQWNQLILVDGFAGRGRYMNGEPGSPKIMFDRSVQVVEDGHAKSVWIRCSEANPTNFAHLKTVCADLKHDRVKIEPRQQEFANLGAALSEWAERQSPPPPIFVFVDPYGVRGVTLDLLARLLKIERLEVLLTFMVRDPARFLLEDNYEAPMTALYGGEGWRDCAEAPSRPECLMLKFREVILNGIAKHALPFCVYEDERRTILYYLVHLTNNGLGMREMKEAMIKKSGDMTFLPVTVRNPDQLELEVHEEPPHPTLQRYLRETYGGRAMTFEELLNTDYPRDNAWVETHYRAAIKGMEKVDPAGAHLAHATHDPKGASCDRAEASRHHHVPVANGETTKLSRAKQMRSRFHPRCPPRLINGPVQCFWTGSI